MTALSLAAILLAPALGIGLAGNGSGPADWPTSFPIVLRGFSPPSTAYGPGHRGIDLAARPGDQVLAPLDGTVSFAGSVAGTPVVSLVHVGNLRTTYEPVETNLSVGATVRLGQPFAVVSVGLAHCGLVPPCLHWGALRGSEYIDPATLVQRSPPVLLPVPIPAEAPAGSGATSIGANSARLSPISIALTSGVVGSLLGAGALSRRRRRRVLPATAAQPWCASDKSGFP